MEADGLHSIGEYTRRRQANIAEKLAWIPIYEICAQGGEGAGDGPDGDMVGLGCGKWTWGVEVYSE